MGNFIVTETFGDRGEGGEKLVWDSVKVAFSARNCLGYWRYPIFSQSGKFRKETDVLIADRFLGLMVIEVKGIKIEQLVNIQGHQWEYHNFYTESGNPYQQAERQLFALLEYSDREPLLKQKVTSKVLIALPYITQAEWQNKGFHKLPNSPPILFQEHLGNPQLLLNLITNTPPLIRGEILTPTQWELLLAVLGGTPLYQPDYRYLPCRKNSRRHVITQVRSRLTQLDLQQEKIAKQIPNGMQRIRGIAGSGKTVLLCQKAALMSVKYPEWQIALVFFSRSLYDSITQQVDKWIRHYTQDKTSYHPQKSNLKILHAWGSKQQPGFYSTICKAVAYLPLAVPFTTSKKPNEALAEACVELLENRTIPQLFDAVLIDEAQDLIANNWKYQDKQPFYWLVYQSLRPVNSIHPEQRRLIWAYDELQSLDSLNLPEPREMFGEELGHLVTGKYNQQINKTEIIYRCYRTPHQVIFTAHAIAMGLLRKKGIITGSKDVEEWQALGYKISQGDRDKSKFILKRESHNSPNIINELCQEDTIHFDRFTSRQQELTVLAQKIEQNLNRDNLQPDREILIIVLGEYYDTTSLVKQTATFLINQGINIYLPSQSNFNRLDTPPEQRNYNQFWYPGAITISTIYRAKGQEADMVYLIGLDNIARHESNLYLRNQLLVALTRTRAWVNISGIGDYALYQELRQLINSKEQIKINIHSLPQRELRTSDRSNLLQGYALGRTNFRYANLSNTDLSGLNLTNINLIEADLSNANLQGTNLTNAKLIAANLTNTDLTNANLTNAKLIGANLNKANLNNANLTNANLLNTILETDN
ncbi:pentapeptide repeat-containing protein [Waterburya agarophytonicola K14]|uniref:Pentapeptide repeat-containing protein n=1 Tax=Waterburya agarophytonicola KI4 TaxID=2874699 RepID=A0A964FKV2_9CYAN|nr:pentapeptide repeat-containing protein [Waterburya agarophytonicola]MCC0178993.1 pentapeptide repeat-containing protein [Waterburya agarophytonicola KI4]